MKKSGLMPGGGILIILCFFLPWIRACGVDISGAQLASDPEIGEAVFWLIPLAGAAILLSYLALRERARFIAALASLAGLFLLLVKIIRPLSEGQARQIGLSLQIGGYGTILGLLMALIGGILAGRERNPEEDAGAWDGSPPVPLAERPEPSPPQAHPADLIQRAKAKGLLDLANMLGKKPDEASREEARLLWEEALRSSGLDTKDEIRCRYSLGSLYLSKDDLAAAARHLEVVIQKNPGLGFLTDADEATRRILQAEMILTASAASLDEANRISQSDPGGVRAIRFLQERAGALGLHAVPSLFRELGRLCRNIGDETSARMYLNSAMEAPTYGSVSEEEAKKEAADWLKLTPAAGERRPSAEAGTAPAAGFDIGFGQLPHRERKRWARRLLWTIPAIAIVAAAVIVFAVPGQYRKNFKQAREYYEKGLYSQAMASARLAKAKRRTAALAALEDQIQTKIDEQEGQARQAQTRNEYDSWITRAENSLRNGRNAEARRFALLARDKINTAEARALASRADTEIARLRAQDEERAKQEEEALQAEAAAAAKDQAAYRAAGASGTASSYFEYLGAYPNGRFASEARGKLKELRQSSLQGQGGSVPYSSASSTPGVRTATDATLRTLLKEALERLEERKTETTPRSPGSATVELSASRNREKNEWMDQTLGALDKALEQLREARSIADRIPDQAAAVRIAEWIARTEKAREQLVSKRILSDKNSFENQQRVVREMSAFLY